MAAPVVVEEVKEKPRPATTLKETREKKVKQPFKQNLNGRWTISDYKDEVIKFEGDDVQMKSVFTVYDCIGTTIEIVGKASGICLINC